MPSILISALVLFLLYFISVFLITWFAVCEMRGKKYFKDHFLVWLIASVVGSSLCASTTAFIPYELTVFLTPFIFVLACMPYFILSGAIDRRDAKKLAKKQQEPTVAE